MICKVYGIIDITAALLLFFAVDIHIIIKFIIGFILFFKAVPSLFANFICKIYGIVDIIVALVIYFQSPIPDFLKFFLIVIMLIKGVPSLLG